MIHVFKFAVLMSLQLLVYTSISFGLDQPLMVPAKSLSAECAEDGSQVLEAGDVFTADVLGKQPFKIFVPFDMHSPTVKVLDEFLGFECKLLSMKIYQVASGKSCLAVEVSWLPGADNSGCLLEVTFPKDGGKGLLELFMQY